MIEITRRLARQVREVVRRTLLPDRSRSDWPQLWLHAGSDGLRLHATQNDITLLYHDPRPRPPAILTFPSAALAEFEGTADDPVTLELVGKQVRARWQDGGVARSTAIAPGTPNYGVEPPALPKRFTPLPPTFLTALAEAARTTDRGAVRIALTRIQLDGSDGSLRATDSRQLLIHRGFPFPWKEALLVPRLRIADAAELKSQAGLVAVGCNQDHVVLRVGPWTFLLRIDTHARFPDVETVVPAPARIVTRLQLQEADVGRLLDAIPKLPKSEDTHQPVTLDLGAASALRALDKADEVVEVPLTQSKVVGRPMRFSTDRRLLYRALQLGFREIEIVNGDKPVVCRDAQRTYLWMPLGEQDALPPAAEHRRVVAPPNPEPPIERNPIMPRPDANGHSETPKNGHPQVPAPATHDRLGERPTFEDLVNEAMALRNVLADAAQRSARLVQAMKQQHRQSRMVRTALDSLRDLRLGP